MVGGTVGVVADVVVVVAVGGGALEATLVSAVTGMVVDEELDTAEPEHAAATSARRATNVARITTRR